MKSGSLSDKRDNLFSRRNFLKLGSVLAAGAVLPVPQGCTSRNAQTQTEENNQNLIDEYRTLGRTGFKVFSVGMGEQGPEENLVKYAFKSGVNYIDTAEAYRNGNSERIVGKALKTVDRKNIFITTKLGFWYGENFKERFRKCLDRLQTEYVDALFLHSVGRVNDINNLDFHTAAEELKAEGRLKYIGISSHGSEDENGDSMEKVLGSAAEDGRFDLLLLPYNFMNKEAAERVIRSCKQHNLGITVMKTSPGVIETESVEQIDPENVTDQLEKEIQQIMIDENWTKEETIKNMNIWRAEARESIEKVKPFAEKYNATSNEQLRQVGLKWALQNSDVHVACMTINTFQEADTFIPAAGSKLSDNEKKYIDDYVRIYDNQYCRHGCSSCVLACVNKIPVSRIMRYSYYFRLQRREQYAMKKYSELGKANASKCFSCQAPCIASCPHGINVKNNLLTAHSLLRMA